MSTTISNYSEYTVTVKTDESNYGDVTRDEALEIAARITTALNKVFPGIEVRQCPMIGHGKRDVTTGPDDAVCDSIDRWISENWTAAL